MTRFVIVVAWVILGAALSSRAADRTWTGGGGDSKWSTPGNWGGTAPVANDTLFFEGSLKAVNTNDLPEDTSFAGIVFKSGAAAFTLAGKRLTLTGNVTNLSTSAQTVNLPVILTGTPVFYASNGAITVNGALSGTGGLWKDGSKDLKLTASNSYDGVTTVSNGMLEVRNDCALGSTNGNTVAYCKAGGFIQLTGTNVVAEPLVLDGERPSSAFSLYSAGGSNTWAGLITKRNGNVRISAGGSSTLVIKGGVTSAGAGLLISVSGVYDKLIYAEKPINIGTDTFWMSPSGPVILAVAGNTWLTTAVYGNLSTLQTDVANALPANAPLEVSYFSTYAVTVNLNGFDQTVGSLQQRQNPSTVTQQITTPTPATLTVNQATDRLFDGQLNGALSLKKIGTATLTLSNSLSVTTDDITVTNGTLVVAAAKSLGNSTNVTVLRGTLELRTASGIHDAASLSIASPGVIKVGAGLVETVDKLFLDGAQQPSGTWGRTGSGAAHIDDTHFTGDGKVYVKTSPVITPASVTWSAGGADTLLSTAANWASGSVPAFDGATLPVFGTGGTLATVDTNVNLYGISFNRAGNFTVTNGAGSITLGAGGIVAASPDTTSRLYTLAEDVRLAESSTWNVATNGAGVTALIVSGSVTNGIDPYGITKTGGGTLVLAGDNRYDGETVVNQGVLSVRHSNALGTTNGSTTVYCASNSYIDLSGNIAIWEPLKINGYRPNNGFSLYNYSGSNTLYGPVTMTGQIRLHASDATSHLVIRGGVTGSGGYCVLNGTAGLISIYDKPFNIGIETLYLEGGNFVLGVAGSTWGSIQLTATANLKLVAPGVLPPSGLLRFGTNNYWANCSLNMNGFDQTAAGLLCDAFANYTAAIYSLTPATLTVNQSTATAFFGSITGMVSLVKTGVGSLLLTGTNSTYGSFIVSNGTLAVSSGGTLGANCTNVVAGLGTLTLSNSVSIADAATLTIADAGAKVNLAAGVNETVRYLYFGDKQQRAGTYSATAGSGVRVVDTAHFSGAGVLTVLRDNRGTLISVR